MKVRTHTRTAVALASAYLLTISAVSGKSDYQNGYDRYYKQDYAGALPYLSKAVKAKPKDSDCLYYYAVTLHKLGKTKEATDIYKKIVALFPDTAPGVYAKTALKSLDPAYLKQIKDAQADDAQEQNDLRVGKYGDFEHKGIDMPVQINFPFSWYNGQMLFSAMYDNNWPGQAIIDPRSTENVIGSAQLKQVNPRAATESPKEVTMSVQVGNLTRQNLKFKVQQGRQAPAVIGKDWTESYNYSVNRNGQILHLVRISLAQQYVLKKNKQEAFEVPLFSENGQLCIDVDFGDGIKARCHVGLEDPAVQPGVTMSRAQFNAINPPVVDASTENREFVQGQYGVVKSEQRVTLKGVRIQKIFRDKFPCLITDTAPEKYPDRPYFYPQLPNPTIGADVFAGWNYKLDSTRKVIRFFRAARGTNETDEQYHS